MLRGWVCPPSARLHCAWSPRWASLSRPVYIRVEMVNPTFYTHGVLLSSMHIARCFVHRSSSGTALSLCLLRRFTFPSRGQFGCGGGIVGSRDKTMENNHMTMICVADPLCIPTLWVPCATRCAVCVPFALAECGSGKKCATLVLSGLHSPCPWCPLRSLPSGTVWAIGAGDIACFEFTAWRSPRRCFAVLHRI